MTAQERTTGPNWAAAVAVLLGAEAGWWAFNAFVFAFGGAVAIAIVPVVLGGLCILSAVLLVRSNRSGFWLGLAIQAPATLQGFVLFNSYARLVGLFAILIGLAVPMLLLAGRMWRHAR